MAVTAVCRAAEESAVPLLVVLRLAARTPVFRWLMESNSGWAS
jgi:hypothetical protein